MLRGCAATTLAGYLQALGLLRVLTLQRDPGARLHWVGNRPVLTTGLDHEELLDWLIDAYRPSPIISPWNSGSGFAGNGKSPAAERALTAIADSTTERLAPLRAAIHAGRAVVVEARRRSYGGTGEELWAKEHKTDVIQLCRNMLPDDALLWIDAAVALTAAHPAYNPLAGTGGNFGRQELSATFLQRLLVLIGPDADRTRSRRWGQAVLMGDESVPYLRETVGQYDPGRAGGIHSSPGEKSDDSGFVNPWANVLTLEGVLLFAGATVRRHGTEASSAALPFLTRSTAVGHSTAAEAETVKGELWAPLWPRPATLAEIGQLLGEGRATWRGRQARTGLDFVLAVAALGVDRGIGSFSRFVIAERLGQNPLAVAAGRVQVRRHPEERLLRAPYDWVRRVQRAGLLPAGIATAVRQVEREIYAVATGEGPGALRRFVIAFGRLHEAVARSGAIRAQVPPFSSRETSWAPVLGDGGEELRIALGYAGLRDARPRPHAGLRELLTRISISAAAGLTWSDQPATGIEITGSTLAKALAEAHRRRTFLPPAADSRPGAKDLPTEPISSRAAFPHGRWVPAALLERFTLGDTNDELIADYLRGLLVLGCDAKAAEPFGDEDRHARHPIIRIFLPFFGTHALNMQIGTPPRPVTIDFSPRADWVPRLIAAGPSNVLADVLLRLKLAGCPPVVTEPALRANRIDGVRLAAALLLLVPPAHRIRALNATCQIPTPDLSDQNEGILT